MATQAEVERQIAALVALGDTLADAEAIVRDALGLSGDLSAPVEQADVDALADITADDQLEARLDWYANPDVEARYKRLLDAKEQPT